MTDTSSNLGRKTVNVTVTGAAGQISYSLLFRIASGDVFGSDTNVNLKLLEIEPAMKTLEGVAMELDDCAFPLLSSIELTSDANTAFKDTNWALLVGSVPRKAGMERKDLLSINGGIFKPQGIAIENNAASDVRILVVGNPCNTNCLIARANATSIPDDRWFAMTRLDQNRAQSMLGQKVSKHSSAVSHVAIWGNHSSTQFPDFENAFIDSVPVPEVISDRAWLEEDFIKAVQQRGAAVIQARGSSSAASAANGVVDSVRSVINPTIAGDCVSLAVVSHGEYGVPEGLIFGLPIISDGSSIKVETGLSHSEFAAEKIRLTTEELLEEKESVKELGLI